MPDPILYSTKSTAADGTVTLVLTDPAKKEELKTIWGKTINNQIASWTKYEEFSKGLFETTIGQLHKTLPSLDVDVKPVFISRSKTT
jgi:hypothetical protein